MSEEIKNPIPSPFMDSIIIINDKCIEEVDAVIKKYGYTDFFLVTHKKKTDGSCEICGGSSFQSDCLLNFLKKTTDTIEDSLNDVDK